MAQLKDGKAMINIKNEQTGEVELKKVNELTPKDIESLKMSGEESAKTVEQLAIDQLDELKQIKGLMDGTLKAAEYGKATTPALSKLFYGLRDVEKSVAQRTSDEATTKGVRKTVGGLTQPVEDLAVATIKGDEMGQMASFGKLVTNASDLTTKGVATMLSIANEVSTDVKDILGKSYMNNNVDTKTTKDVNLKLDVDVKGGNTMTAEEVHKIVISMFNDSDSRAKMFGAADYQPGAAVGSKNQ
jgi:hypothetical protein